MHSATLDAFGWFKRDLKQFRLSSYRGGKTRQDGAECGGWPDVHADSPAKYVQ